MVKNISNPLNARRVAQILSEDAENQKLSIEGRKISVFLSDHRISDLGTALIHLKQEGMLPDNYVVSEPGIELLITEDFIENSNEALLSPQTQMLDSLDLLGDIDYNSNEFKSQLESLKGKFLKSWSGGISSDGQELENFDRKFARPMKYFKQYMEEEENQSISDLQAFSVVYATDYLSLGDSSKEDTFEIMFNRFDKIKQELDSEFNFSYNWPNLSGTSFIEHGKKYSIHPELAELAKKLRTASGLDTYSDEVIQVFFLELVSCELFAEMLEKKLLYRWNDGSFSDLDPVAFLIPPPDFNIDKELKLLIVQSVITDTILSRIVQDSPSLIELLRDTKEMSIAERSVYFAKILESSLTQKAIALQFGKSIVNFFENFKTNPAKIVPFFDNMDRYYLKADSIESLFLTIEHSIRTGIKNSTGLLKQHLRNVSDDQLIQTVKFNLQQAIRYGITSILEGFENSIILDSRIKHHELDALLHNLSPESRKHFFNKVLDKVFQLMSQYTKNLEVKREKPISMEGGLKELTHDFLSTAFYHGSKNPASATMISKLIEDEIDSEIAELIVKISSYITYQIGSKEGQIGSDMHADLVHHYSKKAKLLSNISLIDGSLLKNHEQFKLFLKSDLQQAHVLVSLSSKLRTDVYNSWTPLDSSKSKNALYLNEFIIPNMLFWQRLPRELVKNLKNFITKTKLRELVGKTGRFNMIEAYSLLVLGNDNSYNTFEDAYNYLQKIFKIEDLEITFAIKPYQGEAEVTIETVHLWNSLQEE